MECTQRLEFTQELYDTHTEKTCPDQIGFLGICGAKYPIKHGPNKIGRDPQTCNVVLNLNSISRQHAVINILNSKEFMIMDLDSANKTKLLNKTLPPYIPHPLVNGDTVQFGDVFGIFRLLEEDDELPMTQALDIPDTPVVSRHASKLNKAAITTIPESPDVSDKDDSFILASQPKKDKLFNNLQNHHFIKPAMKTITIQPVGSKKIDNVYWNSSKKSTSLYLNDTNNSQNDISLNNSLDHNKDTSIHEMETQAPVPNADNSTDAIYTANTQIPNDIQTANCIHSQATQLLIPPNLPAALKIDDQQEMHIDMFTANKENNIDISNAETQVFLKEKKPSLVSKDYDNNIFNAETQVCPQDKKPSLVSKDYDNLFNAETQVYPSEKNVSTTTKDNNCNIFNAETQVFSVNINSNLTSSKLVDNDKNYQCKENETSKMRISDEELLFDEIDSQSLDEDFASQALLPADGIILDNDDSIVIAKEQPKSHITFKSDSSTDCEDINDIPTNKNCSVNKTNNYFNKDTNRSEDIDILPTQIIPAIEVTKKTNVAPKKRIARIQSDSSTDCEDDVLTQKLPVQTPVDDDDITDCEEEFIELNKNTSIKPIIEDDADLVDMATQIISAKAPYPSTDLDFEDLPTQVIGVEDFHSKKSVIADNNISFEDLPTQLLDDDIPCNPEIMSNTDQFSEEIVSHFKIPFNLTTKAKVKDTPKLTTITIDSKTNENDDVNYYVATQDLYEDLCSQRELSPEVVTVIKSKDSNYLNKELSGTIKRSEEKNKSEITHKKLRSSFSSEGDEYGKDIDLVENMSSQQICDIIGVDKPIKVSSNLSDLEVTPKKVQPHKFMNIDLPNSQEIKNAVTQNSRNQRTESSSDSDFETSSEEQSTNILFHYKKKSKVNPKLNLSKKIDIENLPTRVITRLRKPSDKLMQSDNRKMVTKNLLTSRFLLEQEDDVAKDIIYENISRLKTKLEKSKANNKKKNIEKKLIDMKTEKPKSSQNDKPKKGVKDNEHDERNDTTKNLEDSHSEKIKGEVIEDKKQEKQPTNNLEDSRSKKTRSEAKKDKKQDKKSNNVNNSETLLVENTKTEVIKARIRDKLVENTTNLESSRVEKNKTEISNKKQDKQSIAKTETTNKLKHDENSKSSDLNSRSLRMRKINNDSSNSNANRSEESETFTVKRSTRSTRKQKNDIKISPEKKEKTQKKESQKRTTKPKNKDTKDQLCEIQSEVRRSKRQQSKEKKTVIKVVVKSILKKTQSPKDQSTVYNLSSGSNSESPRSLKRSSTVYSNVPSPKRARSVNSSLICATSVKSLKTQYVLFTAFSSQEVKSKLESLGAVVVTDVSLCSVVLTLSIKRTFKLLCAVGLGKPIVGPSWVQACVDSNTIVDPWMYILRDESADKLFSFDLQRTLQGKRNFLYGYNVSATPTVAPNATEMKLIVECSGGVWKEGGPHWVCVSSSADKALWPALRKRGAILVTTEFIIGGVLKQKLDIQANKL